jgi:hypothetical protein
MAEVMWNLLGAYPNPGEAFAQSFQQGMAQRQEQQQRNALAALAMNPADPQAQSAAAQFAPQAVMQARAQQQQSVQQQLEAHRDNILKGAELIRQVQPKDQASWDQARALAAQAGIDISEVPAQFDPQYVQGITALADAFAPQTQHNPQIVTTQAGGGVFRIDPATGQAIPLILPNDGSHAPGAPANMPRVTDQASYDAIPPGGQYMDPQGNIRTKGGQSGAGSAGGFPSGGH